jgi:inner membrane protein involved in colicin E2 resistance
MMIGIMQLAEGGDRGRIGNHVQVVFWTVTFVLLVLSAITMLAGREVAHSLAVFVASGILFHVLTYLQPSLLLGSVLVLALAALAWWPERRRH